GQSIRGLKRRGKYLLFELASKNHILMHLGVSGSLSVVNNNLTRKKHDHFEMLLPDNQVLRFHDPRRFGCILLTDHEPNNHPLLIQLGPEPLSPEFYGQWLKKLAQNRKVAVKNFIMNAQVVVGVGNIYASEALFMAGIHPKRAAKNISLKRYQLLAEAIQQVLQKAIIAGGTTLRDFSGSDGKPGYFKQSLQVYDREHAACNRCGQTVKKSIIGARSSYYCGHCQT